MERYGAHGAAEGAQAGTLSRRRALLLVACAAAFSAVLHLLAALDLSAPWVMPDELIYSELAKSVGDGALPAVRGEATLGYGLLYPLLIAPAWALFADPADAFVAAKVVNAVTMSLAAFPAFFLAARFVTARSAVIVAALAVFVPSMLLAGTLLIEVLLYPLWLLALLAVVVSLQEPTRRNQVLAVGAIALACLAKPLSVVLAPAYVLAIVHLGLLDRRVGGTVRARLRRHATALVILGVGAALAVVVPLAAGDPGAALGVYSVVLGHVDPSGTLVWFVRHLAGLDLSVAILPFAATLVLVGVSTLRGADARTNELAAVAVWTIGGTLAAVAAYSSKPLAGASGYVASEARLHERNIFALSPLLLIGLALFLERKPAAPRWLNVGALAVAILLPVTIPLEKLLATVNFQAISLIPWTVGGVETLWPWTLVVLGTLVSVVFLGAASKRPARAWALVAASFALTMVAAHASMSHPEGGASSTLEVGNDTRWIDRAVPPDADVLALWVGPEPGADFRPSQRTIWMSEFYNRSVGTVVEVGRPMLYDLPHVTGAIRDGALVDGSGAPIAARYALVPCGVDVEGRVIARDARVSGAVYQLPTGPIRVAVAENRAARCETG
jgi:hypothetical protein